MKHLVALMNPAEFARRAKIPTVRFGKQKLRTGILIKIHKLLKELPPKTMIQSRWNSLDEIVRLCNVYVGEKQAQLHEGHQSSKLEAVMTLRAQAAARRLGEEQRAEGLHARVTHQPVQQRGRLGTGRNVHATYQWEKAISNNNTRLHGEEARNMAGQGRLGPVELRGANANEVRADDLYALKNLFKGLEWAQIEAAYQRLGRQAKGLEYFNDEERQRRRLTILGSTFYSSNLQAADTSRCRFSVMLRTSIYVASQDGDIYCFDEYDDARDQGRLQHSSFLAGDEVMCAGTIRIDNGTLVHVSNSSGHYRPGLEDLLDLCIAIQSQYTAYETAFAFYQDFARHFAPHTGIGHFMIPMGLFIETRGRPPNPHDFEGDIYNYEWRYVNENAARTRGGNVPRARG